MNTVIIDPNADTKRSEGGRILLPPPPMIVIAETPDMLPAQGIKKPKMPVPRQFAGYDIPIIIGQGAPQLH